MRSRPLTKAGLYLDLESPADRERLAGAQGYLGRERGQLVVLDEIHRAPRLFEVLRGIIDERIQGGEPRGSFFCSDRPPWTLPLPRAPPTASALASRP